MMGWNREDAVPFVDPLYVAIHKAKMAYNLVVKIIN
jgi:hypothetical protein